MVKLDASGKDLGELDLNELTKKLFQKFVKSEKDFEMCMKMTAIFVSIINEIFKQYKVVQCAAYVCSDKKSDCHSQGPHDGNFSR